jgi:hypothetical protein
VIGVAGAAGRAVVVSSDGDSVAGAAIGTVSSSPVAANARGTAVTRSPASTIASEFLILRGNIKKINIQDVSYTPTGLCQKKACRKEKNEYTIYTFVL